MKTFKILLLSLFCINVVCAQKAINANIKALLNVRIVTTISNNQLSLWTDALDGGTSGMATQSAVLANGDKTSIALPDDGVFPADEFHPKVVLNYSNAQPAGFQARRSKSVDTFNISTPKNKYEKVFLFCMSGNGVSNLKIQFNYSDKTSETCERIVPDWYNVLKPTDVDFCYLAKNMGKWDKTNKLMEADHHYLIGVILRPNETKKLSSVEVIKGKKGILTLWGVTLQPIGKKN
jgi:hypothetical protein